MVEKRTGHYIKALKSDRGSEYMSTAFTNYCKEHGIKRIQITPSPQENNVAKGKNRTILDMVRSMLKSKNMPKDFWAEAVRCAVYIQNRSFQARLKDKTPQEAWSGIKPTVSHLKVFGSVAYARVPDQRRTKLDDKSKKYVFIGYDEKTKAFRLCDPIEKKVITSRDVQIHEESAWDWNNQKEAINEDNESDVSASMPTITNTSHDSSDDEDEPRQPGMRSLQELYDSTCEPQLVVRLSGFALFRQPSGQWFQFVNVAKESDAANKPYELRILSEDESQHLLLKIFFPNQPANKCPDNLLPLVNQFAQKCGGWPLALVVLGGILSTKDLDYNIWNEILLKLDWQIEGSKCLDIISTSYDDLPIHLKQCFMYIASFPEDYKMRAATLIQLWIAEGIIQHESTKKMEKTAESYMEELVQRCLIQVSKRSWSGRIKYCYIHDILRELAILKSKENNFLQVFSKSNADSTPRISDSTRRIAFHEYVNTELPIGLIGPNLRSLIHFRQHLPNYNKLSMVRVLHLEYSRYIQYHNDNPKWLKYLTTLKYFRTNIEFYPSKMPTSFWNNMMLRYVKMAKGSFVMGPPSSANLVNLVTLKGVVARGGWKVKLPHFPHIRKLGIFIGPGIDWEALTNSMAKLEHLDSLSVTGDQYEVFTPGLETVTDHQRFKYTPAFKSYKQVHSLRLNYSWPRNTVCDSSFFPPQLVKLTLKNSYLEQDLLSALEELPSLKVLRMLDFSYRGKNLIFYARGFKCLQQLKISCLLNLLELKVEEGAMPMLNLLKIRYCIQLEMVPDLQYLTNLRELKLREMSYEFMSKLKGADQHKIKHIPSVNIY
ncbi:hypothetical protein LUZ61_012183 [Rhynchospora tenuis]|uniref:Integrase catalytic domain-containing protein n=1 Tax=Rhynchospora tenuis TaxID=198213 RepID=A0AAD6F195_9POAL|nr:hypothetical protein LUZ61_012183 [Rhynchospora tenuis]